MKTKNKTIKQTIYLCLLLIIASIFLLIFAIGLREIFFANKRVMTDIAHNKNIALGTTKENYAIIKTDTPLIKNLNNPQEISNTYFLLPAGYTTKVISTQKHNDTEYAYVFYNGFYGYALKEHLNTNSNATADYISNIKITLKEDAGTHLRLSPQIKSDNIIYLLSASQSNINFIGYIKADTPADGTSNNWYYISVDLSDTKVLTGYIYSERCLLSSPIIDKTPSTLPEANYNQAETFAAQSESTTKSPLKINSFVFWIILILFSLPIIGIFIFLIFKPNSIIKQKRIDVAPIKNTKEKEFLFSDNQTNGLLQELPPYREDHKEKYKTEYHFNGKSYEKKYILDEDEIEEFQDLPKSCLKGIKKKTKFIKPNRNSPFQEFNHIDKNNFNQRATTPPTETIISQEDLASSPPQKQKKSLLTTFFEKIKQETSDFTLTDK